MRTTPTILLPLLSLLGIAAASCSPINASYDKDTLFHQNAPITEPDDGAPVTIQSELSVLVYKTQLLSSDALTLTLKAGAAANVRTFTISDGNLPSRLAEFKTNGKTLLRITGAVPPETTGIFVLNLDESDIQDQQLQGHFDTTLTQVKGDLWMLSISSNTPSDIREHVLATLVSITLTAKNGTWTGVQEPRIAAPSPSPSPVETR